MWCFPLLVFSERKLLTSAERERERFWIYVSLVREKPMDEGPMGGVPISVHPPTSIASSFILWIGQGKGEQRG